MVEFPIALYSEELGYPINLHLQPKQAVRSEIDELKDEILNLKMALHDREQELARLEAGIPKARITAAEIDDHDYAHLRAGAL